MRILFGCKVPDGARLVELRAHTNGPGRFRTIFRGPLDEAENNYTLTEDSIIDQVSQDERFWEWVGVQLKNGRIYVANHDPETGSIRLRVTVVFINQDGSHAILDSGSGATSFTCSEPWDFHRNIRAKTEPDQTVLLLGRMAEVLIEQQKALPEMITKLFKEVSENGRVTVQASTQESAKILHSIMEPMKQQLSMIEKYTSGETLRANKATDACIRQLNASAEGKSWTGSPDDWIGAAKGIVQLAEGLGKFSLKG